MRENFEDVSSILQANGITYLPPKKSIASGEIRLTSSAEAVTRSVTRSDSAKLPDRSICRSAGRKSQTSREWLWRFMAAAAGP